MIQPIYDYKREGYNNIDDIITLMERIETILLLQFGIEFKDKNLKREASNISNIDELVNYINTAYDRFIIKFSGISDLHVLINNNSNFNNTDEETLYAYKSSLIISLYTTICKLLDENDLIPIGTLGKMLIDNDENRLFNKSRIIDSGQNVFSRQIRRKDTNNNIITKTTNPQDYYLYDKIIPLSEQYKHTKNTRRYLSKFCFKTSMFILNNFEKLAPEKLYKDIEKTKNSYELFHTLRKYAELCDKLHNILTYEFKNKNKNNMEVLNDIIAFETIIPLNLLKLLLSDINFINSSNIPDEYINIQVSIMDISRTYNSKIIVPLDNKLVPNKPYYLKYNNNMYQEEKLTNDDEKISKFCNNVRESIFLFSNVIYPLISKAFFTNMYYIFSKNTDVRFNLNNLKLLLEEYLKSKIIPLNFLPIFNNYAESFKKLESFSKLQPKDSDNFFIKDKNLTLKFIQKLLHKPINDYKIIDYCTFTRGIISDADGNENIANRINNFKYHINPYIDKLKIDQIKTEQNISLEKFFKQY